MLGNTGVQGDGFGGRRKFNPTQGAQCDVDVWIWSQRLPHYVDQEFRQAEWEGPGTGEPAISNFGIQPHGIQEQQDLSSKSPSAAAPLWKCDGTYEKIGIIESIWKMPYKIAMERVLKEPQ